MLGQHLCEGLCFTKPMALDWSNTHKHFMQLCCLALTPSVINCHWDKFSGLWHEFFGLQNGLQWESGLASNGRVRGFSPPFNQEAYLVWDITRKLFMYFHSTSALATALLSLCGLIAQISEIKWFFFSLARWGIAWALHCLLKVTTFFLFSCKRNTKL